MSTIWYGPAGVPSRTQTLVRLTDDLVAELDRRAVREGVSRSALIRTLLAAALAEPLADSASQRIRAGYQRAPQSDARDAWGDLDRWTEANVARSRAALSDEEDEQW